MASVASSSSSSVAKGGEVKITATPPTDAAVPPAVAKPNPYCFFDVQIGKELAGRIVFVVGTYYISTHPYLMGH
jgi:hypothetical protein